MLPDGAITPMFSADQLDHDPEHVRNDLGGGPWRRLSTSR
jgi:hypothetical protein